MGAVADEEHRAMPEPLHPPAAEGIDAHPIQLELHRWAEHLPQPRQHALRPAFDVGIGIGRELEVDAEDVVRLTVQQHRPAGVERRIEPEPALARRSEEHTSELQSLMRISYAVFCLKKKNSKKNR